MQELAKMIRCFINCLFVEPLAVYMVIKYGRIKTRQRLPIGTQFVKF